MNITTITTRHPSRTGRTLAVGLGVALVGAFGAGTAFAAPNVSTTTTHQTPRLVGLTDQEVPMVALLVIAALCVVLVGWACAHQRRRGARGHSRSAFLAAVGVAGLLVAPTPAWASPSDHGVFSSHELFVDSEVCAPEGFSVDVVEDEIATFRVFFDRTGAVARVAVHRDYRAVISANGQTIVERDTWTDTFFPDGSSRTVGNTVHIQGQGPGLVQHDAGQIVFGADGSVQAIHGPHPQFEGQTFCFALLP